MKTDLDFPPFKKDYQNMVAGRLKVFISATICNKFAGKGFPGNDFSPKCFDRGISPQRHLKKHPKRV